MPDPESITPARKWGAIAAANLVLLFSYWSVLFASALAADEDAEVAATPFFSLGIALVPFVFLLAAFVSHHRHAPGGVLRAMGLFIVVALPVSVFSQNPAAGLAAGFGAGGTVSLRANEEDSIGARFGAVAVVTLYLLILGPLIPEAAALGGCVLALPALGIADAFSGYRQARESG